MAELAVITFSVNYLRSHPSHKHQGSKGYTLHFWPVVRNYQCLTHGQACMHSNSQAHRTQPSLHTVCPLMKFLLWKVSTQLAEQILPKKCNCNDCKTFGFTVIRAVTVWQCPACGLSKCSWREKMIEIIQYELNWLLHWFSQSMQKPRAVFINEKKSLVSWCGVVLIKNNSCQSGWHDSLEFR